MPARTDKNSNISKKLLLFSPEAVFYAKLQGKVTVWPFVCYCIWRMGPLISLLFRIASGEPFRHATPGERRWYAAFFLFLPIYLFSFAHLTIWARYVPAIASVVLGVLVWAITFWMSFTGRFI